MKKLILSLLALCLLATALGACTDDLNSPFATNEYVSADGTPADSGETTAPDETTVEPATSTDPENDGNWTPYL